MAQWPGRTQGESVVSKNMVAVESPGDYGSSFAGGLLGGRLLNDLLEDCAEVTESD